MHEVKEKVKEKIDDIISDGIEMNNIDVLGKLVDIHKDIENEEYWKIKEEVYENELSRIWKRKIWKRRIWKG